MKRLSSIGLIFQPKAISRIALIKKDLWTWCERGANGLRHLPRTVLISF